MVNSNVKPNSFELIVIVGLNNTFGGFNNGFNEMKDAFNNVVFSNLYCIQRLYLAWMRKYETQAPLRIRFITFKDFDPPKEAFEKDNPYFEPTQDVLDFRKQKLLSEPFSIGDFYDYASQKEEVRQRIDEILKSAVNYYEHPTNGLEALYEGLRSDFKEGSHRAIVLISDNEAKPLGGPYPLFCPKRYPKSEEELDRLWESLSDQGGIMFFAKSGSRYEELSKRWKNAYFSPLQGNYGLTRLSPIEICEEIDRLFN